MWEKCRLCPCLQPLAGATMTGAERHRRAGAGPREGTGRGSPPPRLEARIERPLLHASPSTTGSTAGSAPPRPAPSPPYCRRLRTGGGMTARRPRGNRAGARSRRTTPAGCAARPAEVSGALAPRARDSRDSSSRQPWRSRRHAPTEGEGGRGSARAIEEGAGVIKAVDCAPPLRDSSARQPWCSRRHAPREGEGGRGRGRGSVRASEEGAAGIGGVDRRKRTRAASGDLTGRPMTKSVAACVTANNQQTSGG